MKKVLQLLILCTLIVLTIPLYAFAESASLPDITADPGESISIPLTVNDMTNLEGMGITVTFDESVIDATGATLTGGVLDGQNYGLQVNTATDGQIVLIIYATANLYSGSGVVAYLEFDVVGSQGDYTNLHFTQFEVNETSYLGNTTDGSVTINGGGTDPSASLPDVTADPGESISIPLTVNDMTNLEGMGVTVTFDESVIDATGATLTGGVLDGQNYGLQVNTATDGQIVLIIYATANLYSGSGVVAYLEFDVVGSQGDYTNLHFTQFEVNETSYLGNTTDGSVTINGGGTDPSASLPDVTADPGESISIPLTVNDMTNLEGMEVTVTFDESVIVATGATLACGVLDGQNYGLQVNTATDGQIVLIIYATANLYSGSGVVAYLEFVVVGSPGDYTILHLAEFKVNETSYLGNTTDGSVTVDGGTDPSASLPDVTADPGESISIPLTVNDMTNIEGMGIIVTFDESVIDSADATLTGGVLDGLNYGLQVNNNTPGQIILIIYATANLYSGDGIVAYLEFDVVGSPGDYTDLHFTQFEVNETSYLDNTTDGSVTIPDIDILVLVVDHDLSEEGYTDCWLYYETALIANGFDYTYYQVAADLVTPDLATMQMYDCIIWFSGECWGYYGDDCMTTTSEVKVASYLDGGGSLFFSAQDYLWASYPSAGSISPGQFPYDYLGLASVSQDMWYIEDPDVLSASGVAASCADGYNFTASDVFTTAKEGLYVDQLLILTADAIGLFRVDSPSPVGICAVQKDTGIFRSIFTTLSFAAIDDQTTANALFGDMINWLVSGVVSIDDPVVIQSFLNAPNPFSNSTTFSFALKKTAHVNIDVYNIKGQLIKNVLNEDMLADIHSITWDGTSNNGVEVPTGVYFTRIITDERENIHKVIVIR